MTATTAMRLFAGWWALSGVAARAFGAQSIKVGLPEFVVVYPEVIKHVPGVKTAIVTIRKNRLDRIVADRLNPFDADIPLANLQRFLTGAVPAGFSRRCKNPQIFITQFEMLTAFESKFQYA